MSKNKKQTLHILLGPGMFLLFLAVPIGGLAFPVRSALGTILWMSWWFVTQPVSQGVTGLLPIAINAFLCVMPMEEVLGCYSEELLFLEASACLISLTWSRTGFDKRLAGTILRVIGPNVKVQLIVWFTVATLMSAVLANIVVVVMLCSISYSMLKFVGIGDVSKSKAATTIMLAIIWGAEHGGMGTPLGGSMSMVVANYMEQVLGRELFYIDWIIRILPFFLALYFIAVVLMMAPKYDMKNFAGSKAEILSSMEALPPMGRDEWCSLLLFLIPIILSFTRPLWQAYLPGLTPAACFTISAIISFFIIQKDGTPLLTFKYATDNLIWNILSLIAGANAMGSMITSTGADVVIADIINSFASNDFILILVLVSLAVLIEEVACCTAAAAIFMPIVLAVCSTTGLPTIGMMFITEAAITSAFCMPVSSRAVPLAYGVKTSDMFRQGLPGTVTAILVISVLGYALLKFCPSFGIL